MDVLTDNELFGDVIGMGEVLLQCSLQFDDATRCTGINALDGVQSVKNVVDMGIGLKQNIDILFTYRISNFLIGVVEW